MSNYSQAEDQDIEIDAEDKDVCIYAGDNDWGSLYVCLTFKQVMEIADKIKGLKDGGL